MCIKYLREEIASVNSHDKKRDIGELDNLLKKAQVAY